ncbi:IclR family transcriptional regulator [Paraglaciecola agarilytica]|uniref:IclR family transcriptional regulator n=1 Tax=Paraglaciecola chathamensis TaxID=368405 RepID=UPI001C083AD8|nr:IclR family transcriptional regulator [Paraglaciecola agarilytica]MBU3019954.1 IclR family transcriptional regulator [Paraglaciecola agarilytica]
MSDKPTTKYAVPALDKGLDILEYLASQELPRSQSEIAQGLGRSPNEIFRVLVGLEARGYLLRDETSGRYRISFKLYNLSRSISPIEQMRQCALPYMEDLAVKIGQSCYLCMLYQSQTMVIIQARSHSPVFLHITEGSLFSTRTSTSGKVLLANSNPSVQAMLLEHDSGYADLNKKQQLSVNKELTQIRENGLCVQPNSLIDGVTDVATLIGQPEGKVIAALAVSSLQTQLGKQVEQDSLINQLQETAQIISEQLDC